MNNEIILTAISLLNAIKDNNLDLTKELVENLNNNFQPNPDLTDLGQIISFFAIFENNNFDSNDALDYALENLNNVNNTETTKWIIKFSKLMSERNEEKIKEFITEYLNSDKIYDYQTANLIQLCIIIDDYELLEQVRKKIIEEV